MAEEINFTICPQCDRCVALTELEDHLFAHELDTSGRENKAATVKYEIDYSKLGEEDSSIITEGIIAVLTRYYVRWKPEGVKRVSLSAATAHISSTPADFGWGCGYRNIQMMFSSLLELEPYKSLLEHKGFNFVPNIPKIQEMIEKAWGEGYDAKGCSELNGKVRRTKKWIGTTEAVSVFRMLGIDAQVVDFAKPTGAKGTHPLMFDWIKNYFLTGSPYLMNHPTVDTTVDHMVESKPTSSASSQASATNDKDYPPLYLQHEGHSRTVIGIEEKGDDVILLLLDPSVSHEQFHRVMMDTKNCMQLLRKTIDQFKQEEYEIVFINGVSDRTKTDKEDEKVVSPYQRFP